jgi:hypothetical protein
VSAATLALGGTPALVAYLAGLATGLFGLGQIGVSLPPYGLAVDASGVAREFTAAEPPREGEAAYLPHSCG